VIRSRRPPPGVPSCLDLSIADLNDRRDARSLALAATDSQFGVEKIPLTMNRIRKALYTKEFREEAVKLAASVGSSEAARRFSIPLKSLVNWMRAAKAGQFDKVGAQQKPLTEVEQELNRVKRELAEVKMERDLLKKFAAYFAKESR
jgi:transposase